MAETAPWETTEKPGAEVAPWEIESPKSANVPPEKKSGSTFLDKVSFKHPLSGLLPPGLRNLGIEEVVGKTALPLGGEVAGGALGAMTPIPGGSMIGRAAGGAGGEALNQLFGITQPSKLQIGLAGAAPPVGAGITKAISPILESGAKMMGGRPIFAKAADVLARKILTPAKSASQLYKEVEAMTGVSIPAVKTGQEIEKVIQEEAGKIQSPVSTAIQNAMKPFQVYFPTANKGIRAIDAPAALEEINRLGTLEGQAATKEEFHALNRVRSALLSDMENSGVSQVKEAAKAYKVEKSLDKLASLFGKPDALSKIEDLARRDRLFRGAFSKPEMEQIKRIAGKLSEVSATGGTGVWGKVATSAASSAVGNVFGGELGAIAGGAAGFIAPDMVKALLRTPFGRNYTERILSGAAPGKKVSEETLAALATFARGMTAQSPERVSANPEVQDPAQR